VVLKHAIVRAEDLRHLGKWVNDIRRYSCCLCRSCGAVNVKMTTVYLLGKFLG
jgi:hypothetical protein